MGKSRSAESNCMLVIAPKSGWIRARSVKRTLGCSYQGRIGVVSVPTRAGVEGMLDVVDEGEHTGRGQGESELW